MLKPVTVVIPAYNEESTIAEVIGAIAQVTTDIHETIVVSDGSQDQTAEIARRAGARVIELTENIGKGGAMMVGAQACQSEIILFLDADLVGLTAEHVQGLITPLLEGEAEMTVGIFGRGRMATDLAQIVAPYLSGQRGMRKEVIQQIEHIDDSGFGVELLLNRYADEHHLSVREVELAGMTHVMKEEKLGITRGFAARLKMYWDIVKVAGKRIG